MSHRRTLIWVAILWAGLTGLRAQETKQSTTATVRGRIEVVGTEGTYKPRHGKIPVTVVWLTPVTGAEGDAFTAIPRLPVSPVQPARLIQKNKSFEPHILVVQAGSMVEFPNHDPFFHNVFSLFEGKRFDLGLYEAGTSRKVRFDRPGISYIFCNIHPEMSAVIITIATPLYAMSNGEEQLILTGVPYGRYQLHVWSEGMGPESEQPLTREVAITESTSSLGTIRVPPANGQHIIHKNKYGRDYDDPSSNNSTYDPQR